MANFFSSLKNFPRKRIRGYLCLVAAIFMVLNFTSCAYNRIKRTITVSPVEVQRQQQVSPFLKAHMRDGRVYVLSSWKVNEKEKKVSGKGELFDINRNFLERGDFEISLEDVAIFETNVIKGSPYLTGMIVISALSVGLSIYCLANPKACFGSCPTFYAWDGEKMLLQAEGFSSSVSPSLEEKDIDSLYWAKPKNRDFEIKVTNEALETHVIRKAELLAVRKPNNGRIFLTPNGEFWKVVEIAKPSLCSAQEGDCLKKIIEFDGIERMSPSNPENLATHEIVELEFDKFPAGKIGLLIGFRQTLLTTYLFYQGLAYMGSSAGYWFAMLERGYKMAKNWIKIMGDLLGGIEIIVKKDDNEWVKMGEVKEFGPIARNVLLLPFSVENPKSPLKIRLKMTQGLWKIDYLALAKLEGKESPISIQPFKVIDKNGRVDREAKRKLLDQSSALATLPGDFYLIFYKLPEDFENYELFIESQGYYLEWIRKEWIAEENPMKTLTMLTNPAGFLKMIAPEYKKVEREMEELFWRSKYGQK